MLLGLLPFRVMCLLTDLIHEVLAWQSLSCGFITRSLPSPSCRCVFMCPTFRDGYIINLMLTLVLLQMLVSTSLPGLSAPTMKPTSTIRVTPLALLVRTL